MTPALRLLLRCALIFITAHAIASERYPLMPQIAPIGERIAKYQDIPESARGPAINPDKGYRLQELGDGLYMVTDNIYQSMFLVYDRGVVVVDAPPNYAKQIPRAIAEVTNNPVTHVIYSHSHIDHIGGVTALGRSTRPSSPTKKPRSFSSALPIRTDRSRPSRSRTAMSSMLAARSSSSPTMETRTNPATSSSTRRHRKCSWSSTSSFRAGCHGEGSPSPTTCQVTSNKSS